MQIPGIMPCPGPSPTDPATAPSEPVAGGPRPQDHAHFPSPCAAVRRGQRYHRPPGPDDEGLDGKAAQVFRFAALILGLVTTGASFLASGPLAGIRPPILVFGLLGAGLLSLTASALVALLAYQVTTVWLGLRAEDLVDAVDDQDLDKRTFHREAVIT